MLTSLWFFLCVCIVLAAYSYVKQSLPAISNRRQKKLHQFLNFATANDAGQLKQSDLNDFWHNSDGIDLIFNEDRLLRNALFDNAQVMLKINEELTTIQSDSQLHTELNDSRKQLVKWFKSTIFNLDQILLAEANNEPSNTDIWRECKRIMTQSIRA